MVERNGEKMYITSKSINEILTAARGIQKTANDELGETISIETALQVVNAFMICDEVGHLKGTINNLNLILRHED